MPPCSGERSIQPGEEQKKQRKRIQKEKACHGCPYKPFNLIKNPILQETKNNVIISVCSCIVAAWIGFQPFSVHLRTRRNLFHTMRSLSGALLLHLQVSSK